MSRFLIRHPETGAEYGLDGAQGVTVFKEVYEPQGFVIPEDQPNYGGDVWEVPKIDDKPARRATRAATEDAE